MSDIKVRVGQKNAVKVISSVSGSAGGRAVTSENVIGGIASITQLNVSGISTFSENLYVAGNLGVGTLPTIAPATTNLIVGGDVKVIGVLTAKQLFSDIYGEFTGGTVNARSIVGTALSISGISTFTNGPVIIGGILKFDNNVRIGNLFTGSFLNPSPTEPDPDVSRNNVLLGNYAGFAIDSGYKNNIIGYYAGYSNTSGIQNNIFGSNSGFNNQTGSFNIFLGSYSGISVSQSNKIIIGRGYNYGYLFDSPDTTKNTQFAVGVRTDENPSKYWLVGNENFNIGIGTINPTSKLTVGGDGYFTGVVTSSNFYVGNSIVGTGGSFSELYISGISTFLGIIVGSDATFSGNVTIGGTLTYEDVTNVDAIGLVTARSGARITGGGLNVVGVSTFEDSVFVGLGLSTGTIGQKLQVNGGTYISGNVGIGTTNPTSKLSIDGDVNISGNIIATNIVGSGLTISGISSFTDVVVNNDFYYVSSYTNGVAYFDSSGLMVSTGETSSSIDYTNYIVTTDNSGTPTWSNVIDGGFY